MTQMIAQFVFKEGDPLNVTIQKDKKDDFVKSLEYFQCFIDKNSGIYVNLDTVKYYTIRELLTNPQAPETKKPKKKNAVKKENTKK